MAAVYSLMACVFACYLLLVLFRSTTAAKGGEPVVNHLVANTMLTVAKAIYGDHECG